MKRRAWQVLALVAVLLLVLGMGGVLGGTLVYALRRVDARLPVVVAQAADPGYGVVIVSVVSSSPAAEAGVVRGDILLSVGGENLAEWGDLVRVLGELQPGDEIELVVLHGDVQRTLAAVLDDRDGRAFLGVQPCQEPITRFALQVERSGAMIVDVVPESPADRAGLVTGEIVVVVDGQELDAG